MGRAVWLCAFAASLAAAVVLTGCRGSKGANTATPAMEVTETPADVATAVDAGALATRAAGSPAAKLGAALLMATDYPPDLGVKQQQTKIVAARDVPGLTSEASSFFATVATSSGDEFVNLIAIATDSEKSASGVFEAFTPGTYLPGLTTGARDAAATPLAVAGAPAGASAFSYSGTVPGSVPGQETRSHIAGQALGFVHGRTFVLLIHGMYAPSTREVDLAKIARAIDERLASE